MVPPPPQILRLPNGQNLTVAPVFSGLSFKSIDYAANRSAFPPGWTIVIEEREEEEEEEKEEAANEKEDQEKREESQKIHGAPTYSWDLDRNFRAIPRRESTHPYRRPTLENDHLFISSISNPSSADFKPATSPTRQIAMMLWATLWWYFHQPEPDSRLTTKASRHTAEEGKPKGEWRINISREGIFKGKSLLLKLLRMGLITTDETNVGDFSQREASPSKLFVTRQAFWQIDARIFLFTLAPTHPSPGVSPFPSRPSSPSRHDGLDGVRDSPSRPGTPSSATANTPAPFQSTSHLPTYFPPHPSRYVMSNGVRHPARPPPYRQGEVVYTRFIPSLGQYLSFRVASLSSTSPSSSIWPAPPPSTNVSSPQSSIRYSTLSEALVPAVSSLAGSGPSDVELLHKWMNNPRVSHSWGEQGPQSHQEAFLRTALSSKHSFPLIGCWDGKPFGFFEIYWVKEDRLGQYIRAGDWDRGMHLLVGEEDYRGPHRIKVWLSALVHLCWLSDMRTECVMLEPRVDNTKLAKYCMDAGFFKEREISFPHKQSNLFKIYRDTWEKPEI